MCAVDQKRPFFPRAGPFLDLLPLKGPFSLYRGPYGTPPYGKALTGSPYEPGSRTGPSQRRTTKRLTGRQGPYGKPLTRRDGPYEMEGPGSPYGSFTEKDDEEAYGKAGPLREAPWPLRADRLTGRPLIRLLTRRPLTNYRKAYGKLGGGTLPELGGNFRLCAVDQKRSFFPRAGPFLDLLPFKGPFPLTGALTGRPPYGKAPYGEASYGKAGPSQEAPYEEGRSLREGPGSRTGPSQRRTTKRLTGRPLTGRLLTRRPLTNYRKAYRKLRGGTLPELGGNFRLCAVDQKRPFFPRAGPFLDLLPFKGPFPLYRGPYGTALREGPLRGGFLREGWALTGSPLRAGVPYGSFTEKDDEEPYGKAGPLREAPYEEGRSLREGPVPYGRAGVPYGSFTEKDDEEAYGKAGPLREAPWPLRADRLTKGPFTGRLLTGRPLTGRLLTRRPLTNYRKAYGKLWGETLPELVGNLRLCAVDQKRPFFPRAGPFLDLLPFKGPFSLTGALTGPPYGKAPYGEASYGKAGPLQEAPYEEGRSLREGPVLTGALTGRPPYGKAPYGEASYEKAPYELQESLQEATGRDFTRIGREFPLVCRRPKKAVFS